MQEEHSKNYTLLWIVAAVTAVFGVVLGAYWFHSRNDTGSSITLPSAVQKQPDASGTGEVPESRFLEVTASNVYEVLETLSRPAAYHQMFTVTNTAGTEAYSRTVEIWADRTVLHGAVLDKDGLKHILTDGETAYLWYADDDEAIQLSLSAHMSLEDLLFLPAYALLAQERENPLVDAAFLQEDGLTPSCIYVCEMMSETVARRYWVNVENGLLFKADVLENSIRVYTAEQTMMELLAPGDEAFQGQFVLPNGETPFIAE